MAKIIDIQFFRQKQASDRGFKSWRKSFSESFSSDTMLCDLSDATLGELLRTGPETQSLLYDLIMGALGLGAGAKFFYLEGQEKMKILDISLFMLDQIRFECMRRLDWITDFAAEHYSIIDMILDFDTIKSTYLNKAPKVLESNPEYVAYQQIFHGDREMFVRRQIPAAISTFLKTRHLNDPNSDA